MTTISTQTINSRFIGGSRRRSVSGSRGEQTLIACATGSELRNGRFSAGYLVPLESLPVGMELIPLRKCDVGRVNEYSYGIAGQSPEDALWAVKALYEDVLPRVARGGDVLGLLTDSDVRSGRSGTRSLRQTYVDFFGHSAVAVDLADDGTFRITNGADRIRIARELGITHLPALVTLLS